MTRRRTSLVARIALLAMLLLVLVPSLGRMSGAMPAPVMAGHADVVQTHRAERVDRADHHQVRGQHSTAADTNVAPRRAPAGGQHPDGHDCPYCPILGAMSLTGVGALAVPDLVWPPQRGRDGSHGRPAEVPAAGLGARGPPMRG